MLSWRVITCQANPIISWSGPQDINLGFGPWNNPGTDVIEVSAYLDLNTDGVNDLFLTWDYMTPGLFYIDPLNGPDGIKNETTLEHRPLTSSYRNWPEPEGTVVQENLDGGLVWGDQEKQELILWMVSGGGEYVGVGTWSGADHMFMGVRFDATDGIHYGWIRMSVYADSEGATIHDWAYNTVPGEPIMMGVVPEPSTIALFLVGIVAFGIRKIKLLP